MSSVVAPTPATGAPPALRERVAAEAVRLRLIAGAATLGAAAAVAALLLAAGALLLADGRWITLPAGLPFAAWAAALGAVAAVAWVAHVRTHRLLAGPMLGAAIEREQGLRDGALRAVLEVDGRGALARRAAERLSAQLAAPGAPLLPGWRRRLARLAAGGAAAAALALLALAAVAAQAADGWAALASPARAWSGTLLPPPALVELPPGVLRGESLTVAVQAPGRRTISLRHRSTGGGWRTARLPVVDGRASLALGSVDADVTLLATDGRASSDTAVVRVTDRPFVGDVAIMAVFPTYLRRPPETLPLGEPARVPRGTELRIAGGSSTVLRTVALVAGVDTLRFAVDGRRFAGRVVAERSGRWSWAALGASGLAPDLPAPLVLDVVPDAAPAVEITAPARDTIVLPTDRVALAIAAADDHGLGDVVVRSWRRRADGGQDAEVTTRLDPAGAAEWAGGSMLDLSARELRAGDALHVVVTAVDLSPWRQTGTSRELVLRVPSMTEQRANVRDAADAAVAQARAAAAAQASLAQRTGDAARTRDRSPAGSRGSQSAAGGGAGGGGASAMSYESAERARSLAAEQREIAQQVQEMRQAARELERQLEQAGALDRELQERLREAQRLMQEAMTPQLAEQLRKLEESAQRLSPDETRQALADLAQQQQRLREQLDRSAEMLRRAALEGAMETLRDEARELAQEQRQLADSLGGARTPPAGAPQRGQQQAGEQRSGEQAGERSGEAPAGSEELARRTEQLAQEIRELQQRLAREQAQAGSQRAQEAARHTDASADAMRQAAREQRSGQPEGGRQAGAGEQERQGERQGEQGEQGRERQPSPQGPSAGMRMGGSQGGQQQGSQQQGGQQQGGQQQGRQQPGGQQGGQQPGGQQGGQQPGGQQAGNQAGAGAAQQAASEMERAAEQLAEARSEQVGAWKQELTSELDRSINELMQLAREQGRLEEQARAGGAGGELREQQGAVQQGVQRTGERLQEAGRSSTLLSQRSQQAVAQAGEQVRQATEQAAQQQAAQQQGAGGAAGGQGGQQTAAAMGQAAEALNQAAAALVRDRARANASQSATGFAEMMQEMQRLAQQQGALNSQAAGLMPGQGQGQGQGRSSGGGAEQARRLAEQQRAIARQLDRLSENDRTGATDAMADEARRLAQALEGGADPSTVNRQQRLFRRMLDAGRTLEQDERDDTGEREGESVRTQDRFTPPGEAAGRAGRRYALPAWNELRGLSAEERRLVIEYFRRLNGEAAAPVAPPER